MKKKVALECVETNQRISKSGPRTATNLATQPTVNVTKGTTPTLLARGANQQLKTQSTPRNNTLNYNQSVMQKKQKTKKTLVTVNSKLTLHTNQSSQSFVSSTAAETQQQMLSPKMLPNRVSNPLTNKTSEKNQLGNFQQEPSQITKLLEAASRKAQRQAKLEIHKELLDKHVSNLIDVIAQQQKLIAELKKNQKPRIERGKSMLNPKLGKIKSSTDLLLPFRSMADQSPSSNGDLKKFFLHQKKLPEIKPFDIEAVEESLIEASQSQMTGVDKIDDVNKSIFKDQSAMSNSSIEFDLMRIMRIEQDKQRQQLAHEKLFTESRHSTQYKEQCSSVQSSCNLADEFLVASSGSRNPVTHINKKKQQQQQFRQSIHSSVIEAASILSQTHVTEEYVKQLLKQNNNSVKKNERKKRTNSLIKSTDSNKLSFTAGGDDAHEESEGRGVQVKMIEEWEPPSSGVTTPSQSRPNLPQIQKTKQICDLNAIISPRIQTVIKQQKMRQHMKS